MGRCLVNFQGLRSAPDFEAHEFIFLVRRLIEIILNVACFGAGGAGRASSSRLDPIFADVKSSCFVAQRSVSWNYPIQPPYATPPPHILDRSGFPRLRLPAQGP